MSGNPNQRRERLSHIAWERAEHQLHDIGDGADLLLIFDCCFAGVLSKKTGSIRTAFSNRIFEFLGSTQENDTAVGPGAESFTTALTWALRNLSSEPEGFTTHKLWLEIQRAPAFSKIGQVPVWSERGKSSLHKLKIKPLPVNEQVENDETSGELAEHQKTVKFYLHLQVLWTQCPNEDDVDHLTDSLRDLVKVKDLPIKQVFWRGLSNEDLKMGFDDVAKAVVRKFRRRSLFVKDFVPEISGALETMGSPEDMRPPQGRQFSESAVTNAFLTPNGETGRQSSGQHSGQKRRFSDIAD